MKSRISIEVDFDSNNLPVIQVISHQSDDVRDKLIQSFLQSLQHTSRWCKILYKGTAAAVLPENEGSAPSRWHIVPIVPNEIPNEIKLMQTLLKDLKDM